MKTKILSIFLLSIFSLNVSADNNSPTFSGAVSNDRASSFQQSIRNGRFIDSTGEMSSFLLPDACSNIPGYQSGVPVGYTQSGTDCIVILPMANPVIDDVIVDFTYNYAFDYSGGSPYSYGAGRRGNFRYVVTMTVNGVPFTQEAFRRCNSDDCDTNSMEFVVIGATTFTPGIGYDYSNANSLENRSLFRQIRDHFPNFVMARPAPINSFDTASRR